MATDLDELFASSSVRVHVARGLLGAALAVAAFALIGTVGGWSLLLLAPAVVLWRGCPTCWALGLTQTRERVARDCAPCQVRGRESVGVSPPA